MRATIARPGELSPTDLERWRGFQAADPDLDNPFLSPEFAIAVELARPATRVAVVEDGTRSVAYVPFERRRLRTGTALAYGVSDLQGIVHAPGFTWDARDLLRHTGLSLWRFDHLLAPQRGLIPDARGLERAASPAIDLRDGAAVWRETTRKRSSIVADTERKRRRLEREVGPVRLEVDARDSGVLERVLSWKSAQYRATGTWDRFAVPWVERLVRATQELSSATFAGTLTVLWAGDAPVSALFGLRSRRCWSSWFPAYDVTYARHSPGAVLFLELVAAAEDLGVTLIDLGKGDERYKRRLANHHVDVVRGWVARPSVAAAVWSLRERTRSAASRNGLDDVIERARSWVWQRGGVP